MYNKNFYKKYIETFLELNSKVNLISKNDEKYVWEKHIFDSLAIKYFFEKHFTLHASHFTLLDIGTGGGFPAVPIAITYPDIEVFALDSIRKKINAIETIKSQLDIKNLHTICDRAENIRGKYDLITSRAVAPLKVITEYAMPLLKDDGYFIAYKSLRTPEEIEEAKQTLKKNNSRVVEVIPYDLPLEENHTRNLVVIKKIT